MLGRPACWHAFFLPRRVLPTSGWHLSHRIGLHQLLRHRPHRWWSACAPGHWWHPKMMKHRRRRQYHAPPGTTPAPSLGRSQTCSCRSSLAPHSAAMPSSSFTISSLAVRPASPHTKSSTLRLSHRAFLWQMACAGSRYSARQVHGDRVDLASLSAYF